MRGVVGAVLVLLGVAIMAWSQRLERAGLAVFLAGCAVVAVGAVLVTGWWRDLSA